MALKSETRTILGREIRIEQLGATDGHKLFIELSPMIAEVAGPLSASAGGSVSDVFSAALSPVGDAIRKYLPPDRFIEIAKLLLKGGGCNGEAITFELHFAGEHMASLYPTLMFALEVNYGSFLEDLGLSSIAARMQAQEVSTSGESLPI